MSPKPEPLRFPPFKTNKMRPYMEERFKALLTFVDSNYLHSSIGIGDYLGKRFDIRHAEVALLFKTQLQTRWKDYIYKKKIDHAAEILVTDKPEPFLSIVQIVGWPSRGGADSQRLNCYSLYPWVLDFDAMFTMRFGWRPERWMNLDMGEDGGGKKWEDYKCDDFRDIYRQRRQEKLDRFHTHKETWVDLWSLSDEEKRERGLSFSEMYRKRIYLTRNRRNSKSFATSKAYFESYLFRKQRRICDIQNSVVFVP